MKSHRLQTEENIQQWNVIDPGPATSSIPDCILSADCILVAQTGGINRHALVSGSLILWSRRRKEAHNVTADEAIRTPQFYLLWIVLCFNVTAGIGVLGVAVTMVIFTMYGGGFAAIPAYLSDLFGTKFVGGIHGRLLTAWSTAGVLGPFAITYLRDRSLRAALTDLASKVDASAFERRFGAPLSELAMLIDKKTVTLPKLMALAPPGTIDPSSTLYSSTMLTMAALLVIAFIANALVRPVDAKHHSDRVSRRR